MGDLRIILTGGGTAGHVTPNLALLPYLKKEGFEIVYIGSDRYIESELIPQMGITYYGIDTGMLRRYRTWKNITDPFKVFKGIHQARKVIKQYKPNIIFSKGGFVGLPVAFAGWLSHVPVIIHESDMTPGLANKLALPVVRKICCNFPESAEHLPKGKAVLTGSPIRDELFTGDAQKGKTMCGFTDDKPVIMIIGGSLGAASVNTAIREALDNLLPKYNIVHICGKNKLDEGLNNTPGYVQYEYVTDGLNDIYALSDVVVSRSGANSICEILALKKPNLLIPLVKASRGDQILNARSFEAQGYSMVLPDDECTKDALTNSINTLYENRDKYIAAMEQSTLKDAISTIIELIKKEMK